MSGARSLQFLLQSTEPAILDERLRTAAQTLGYMNLKPEQHCAVTKLVHGRDTFVSLLTGYEKSLVHQVLPACVRDSSAYSGGGAQRYLFVLWCRLIPPSCMSLMQDQLERLSDINVLRLGYTSETFLLALCGTSAAAQTQHVVSE